MPLLTYCDVMQSDIPNIAGVCADGRQFRDYLNKACRMLMTRGNFYGTVQKIQVCISCEVVTWPRYVGTVLAINRCGQPMQLWNNWYQFVPLALGDFCSTGFTLGDDGHWSGGLSVNDDGFSPVFNQIPCGAANYIRAFPSTQEDIGQEVVIFGKDSNGQVIRTKDENGMWQDGVTLELASPFVSTPMTVREIFRISKPRTHGVVRYYQYDAPNDVMLDLVSHEPGETSPMYRKSRIRGPHWKGKANSCPRSIEALVKLEFIPVRHDTDLVIIENQDALRDMIMAIKLADSGDKTGATAYELSAIHELNLELENRFPKTQTPVEFNCFGSASPSHHGIGRIY